MTITASGFPSGVTSNAQAAVTAALSQLGVPYQWGGEQANKDFDCSGLVQWAFGKAGISLPRTSQAQYTVVTHISPQAALPGDLVFSAGSDGTASSPGHVGIYVGGGYYVNAPYTGVNVRVDAVPSDATYGRVPGLLMNATTSYATGGPGQSASGGSSFGCNASGGFLGIGTGCQIKALTGGLLVGAGGGVFLAGALLIAAYGLSQTRVGKIAKQAATFTPVGRVAKVVGL